MSKNSKSYQEPTHQEIAARALAIYEREGRPEGRSEQHWLQAESELIAERKMPASSSTAKPAAAPAGKTRGNDWQTSGRQSLHSN